MLVFYPNPEIINWKPKYLYDGTVIPLESVIVHSSSSNLTGTSDLRVEYIPENSTEKGVTWNWEGPAELKATIRGLTLVPNNNVMNGQEVTVTATSKKNSSIKHSLTLPIDFGPSCVFSNGWFRDTYSATAETKVIISFEVSSSCGDNAGLFGVWNGNGTGNYGFHVRYKTSKELYAKGIYNDTDISIGNLNPGERHYLSFSQNEVTLDNTTTKFDYNTYKGSNTTYFGIGRMCDANGNSSYTLFQGKIYYIKIYEGNKLVRDYSFNKQGCYDKITGNQLLLMTGSFTTIDESSIQVKLSGETIFKHDYKPLEIAFSSTLSDYNLFYNDDSYIEASIDLSNCIGVKENILSFGLDLSNNTNPCMHIYYTNSSKTLRFSYMNDLGFTEIVLDSTDLLLRIDSSGLYVNGSLVDGATSYTITAINRDLLYIGSVEGTVRSNATYNYIKVVFNLNEELINKIILDAEEYTGGGE